MSPDALFRSAYRAIDSAADSAAAAPWQHIKWKLWYWRNRIPPFETLIQQPHRQAVCDVVLSFRPRSVLDVGCGRGANLYLLGRKSPTTMLYGTDISRAAVRDARRNAPGAEIAMESLASLVSYPAKSIDVVLCDAVLMYVPPHKIADAISEMCRLACRGVVISAWTGKPDYNEGAWVHDFEAMGATVTPFPEGSWSDERWNKYGAIVTLS